MKTDDSSIFKPSRRIRMTRDKIAFNAISYVLVTFFAVVCLLPFLMIVTGSFTAEESIYKDGFRIIPAEFSIEAYEILLKSPRTLINAYIVTVSITIIGTCLGLFFTSMTAYVLLRKDFKWRNQLAFFFFFTTLFSGGLVPWYVLMVKYLGLKDSPIVLILPGLFNVFYILIMRNFMKSTPDAILESAKIDGAGDFLMYYKIILPLSGPALATIGLFIALNYWNEWFHAMLFLSNDKLFPLQYYLYRILNSMNFAAQAAQEANIPMPKMPTQAYKMVMTVAATGPIIFVYPFVQRYFIQGIVVGAVKG